MSADAPIRLKHLDRLMGGIKRWIMPAFQQHSDEIDALHARVKALEGREAELRALLDETITELSRTES